MSIQIPTFETAGGTVPSFEVLRPVNQTMPFVFCSPHSGRDYPLELTQASRLSADAIRRSEDLFVDRLFDCVPGLGAPFLAARFPRAFLDVNREPFELDPKMFEGDLPGFVNSASARVAGGLGTIPRIVAEKEEIYRRRLTVQAGLRRIERHYKPFHAALDALLRETRARFGMAVLIDCHSMPSTVRTLPGGGRPDIVVGDRYGESAAQPLVLNVVARLASLGFEIMQNKPYAGGFITESYGRPSTGVHAIQLEINRGLYADEKRFLPHAGLDSVRERLSRFVDGLGDDVAAAAERPAAAE